LTFVEEQLGQRWAQDLKGLLGQIKQVVDAARDQGLTALPAAVQQEFTRCYDAILEQGAQVNPPPRQPANAGDPRGARSAA